MVYKESTREDESMYKRLENVLMRRHIRPGLILAVLCICSLFAGSVQAESNPAPSPYDKEGSIMVSVKVNDTVVPGGSMTMYKVADVVSDNGYRFAYTDDFKDFFKDDTEYSSPYNAGYVDENVFPDAFTSKSTEEASLAANHNANYDMAQDLMTYVSINKLEGLKKDLGTAGSAVFDELAAGLYLFIQDDPADGYYAVTPFLVTLPGVDADGELVWEVNAGPKIETHSREGEPEPVSVDPSISKNVITYSGGKSVTLDNDDLPVGTYFDFIFERQDSSYPMPVNADGSVKNGGPVVSQKGNTMQLRVYGVDTVEVGTITFEEEGEYYYTVEELTPADSKFSRDKQVYSLAYFVTKSEDGSELEVRGEVRDGSSNGKLISEKTNPKLSYTNTYTPSVPPEQSVTPATPYVHNVTPSGKLPQTGQLWWPIWLLAALGIVLIAGGVAIKKHASRKGA